MQLILYLCTELKGYILGDIRVMSSLFALLDVQARLEELALTVTQEEHLLDTVLAVDTEGRLAVEGEVALVVDLPAGGATTLGDSAGVRDRQGDRLVAALDGVEVLPAGGSLAVGSVAHLGVLRAALDFGGVSNVSAQRGMLDIGYSRVRIWYLSLVLPPMKALPGHNQ